MRHVALLLFAASAFAQDEPLTGRALIDHHIRAKLDEIGVRPAGRCDDAEFVRRVHLDLVGTIPTTDRAERFFADRSPYKREKLVDELLASPAFAEHWGWMWARGLMGGGGDNRKGNGAVYAVAKHLAGLIGKDAPYDAFAREIITATGTFEEQAARGGMMEMADRADGLALFYFRAQQTAGRDFPLSLANRFSRLFLGIHISCAQCHDHPFDKWTQEDAYSMGAFFTEVTVKRTGDKDKKEKQGYELADRARAQGRKGQMAGLLLPDGKSTDARKPSGRMIGPMWLGTKEAPAGGVPLRQEFARMLTAKSNTQFARAAVNRHWAQLFGRGIVNPPDDFSGKNKPSHPDLLDQLAADFAANGWSVKRLLREMIASEAYQRTSRMKSRDLERQFGVSAVRALTPEQILNSVLTATSLDPSTVDLRVREQVLQQFRYAFGDDEGVELVEFQGTITAALLMMNGDIMSRATAGGAAKPAKGGRPEKGARPMKAAPGRLGEILKAHASPEDRLRAIHLTCMSRPPTSKELSRHLAHVQAAGEGGYADVMWALLNSSEFLFNH